MDISIDLDFLAEFFPIFLVSMVVLILFLSVFLVIIKNSDNNKPLQIREGKILEKPVQQGSIEWYIIEFENGERIKLRNFNANKTIISIGDIGTIEYRGQTIVAFRRKM